MTILDPGADQELMGLWGLITELSDQLNANRTQAVSLHTQAGNAKMQAVHIQTGFVLRRFNMDLSQEQYDAELERMTNEMAADNLNLQHDNKQLTALIKEYEQTLETLMAAFRNRAREVQEHELALIRNYETQLLARDAEDATAALRASTTSSRTLARIAYLLRTSMRALNGEYPEPPELPQNSTPPDAESAAEPADAEKETGDPTSSVEASADALLAALQSFSESTPDPEGDPAWALERECELARLERENDALRRMHGLPLLPAPPSPSSPVPPAPFHHMQSSLPRSMSVQPAGGLVAPQARQGPYGPYKMGA